MPTVQQSLAVGWFPESEWAVALQRWPSLAEEMPREHVAYRAAIEARLGNVSAGTRGAQLVMVPLTVEALEARAEQDGADAGSTELRGRTASLLAGQGLGTPWPPGRNEPCWCGSARKYKHCCQALEAPAPTGSDQDPSAAG
jgi:SEC-C motif